MKIRSPGCNWSALIRSTAAHCSSEVRGKSLIPRACAAQYTRPEQSNPPGASPPHTYGVPIWPSTRSRNAVPVRPPPDTGPGALAIGLPHATLKSRDLAFGARRLPAFSGRLGLVRVLLRLRIQVNAERLLSPLAGLPVRRGQRLVTVLDGDLKVVLIVGVVRGEARLKLGAFLRRHLRHRGLQELRSGRLLARLERLKRRHLISGDLRRRRGRGSHQVMQPLALNHADNRPDTRRDVDQNVQDFLNYGVHVQPFL